MDMQEKGKPSDRNQLTLHRMYVKGSSFESFHVGLDSFQNPLQPVIEMQVFANAYAQGDHIHQTVLGLKIDAKHKGDLMWRLQLEEAGFYSLAGFTEEQQNNILNGFCMNQLHAHASAVVTQMVTQSGFLPVYLQPMDFNKLYTERKKQATQESVKAASKESNAVPIFSDGA